MQSNKAAAWQALQAEFEDLLAPLAEEAAETEKAEPVKPRRDTSKPAAARGGSMPRRR